MIEVFLIAALMHWVIAPDRFTSAARAATGAAGRAAGAGVRDQWNAGRPGRQVARTARRDDWHARGGWWRRLLGVEHAAVVTGKTARSAGRLTGAAVKPVPAAIKRGWVAGQDRHRARVEGKRVPLTVNPPWWHPRHVEEPEPGQVEDSPQDRTEDTPEPIAGTGQDSPSGQVQPAPNPFFPDAPDGPVLDTEEQIRDRHPDLAKIQPEPLTDGQRRFWHPRDRGYPGAIDQDGWAAPDIHTGALINPMPYLHDEPTPTGTNPTEPAPTEGDPVPTTPANVPTVELNDLDSTRRFAEYVASLGEDSEFMQIVERCKVFREQLRAGGFGGDIDEAGASFEETAATLSTLATEFFDSAQNLTALVDNVRGG